MTRMLRDTLHEWADEAVVPHDLADRALRRRVRWPAVTAVALVTGVLLAVAGYVTGTGDAEHTVRPATEVTLPARPSPAPTDVRADTANRPPRKLVAAGNVAVSAYWTYSFEKLPNSVERLRRVWWLYDPRTGGYERTSWAWLDVAPGLQVAAAIDGDGLGKRLVIVDLNTQRILSSIGLEHAVGSVVWSPDGTELLATTYSEYPDRWRRLGKNSQEHFASTRTGYYIVDAATGEAEHHALPPMRSGSEPGFVDGPSNGNSRQDLGWSADGSLIWEPSVTRPSRAYRTLDGRPQDAPADDRYLGRNGWSRLSPDGTRLLGEPGLPTRITDVRTGDVVGRQQVLQLLAWADDDTVVALGCRGDCPNEFDAGLVLVSVDGTRMTPLTGKSDSRKEGAWSWVLTPR
ncbi:hypothetical protein ACWGH8_09380 [Nonomuraea muscovyensis]|uniref:WD40 repeat domain-containing protein n=1 Tax=Nonomuraea muscovyensis TaxID=1124761 RepID=A0A7X0C214_9ACTN|nr:hypothetical protein [Nonomuraea muscovyensis]MBB6345656.1 hypothetical protein [Nonomuraea muscovyensis]